MELQVIRSEQIPLGKPLPCNIYDREGTLLLKAGEVVHSHRQLDELRVDGLFIPKREKTEPPPEPPKQSPFTILDRLPDSVERLFGYMTKEPNFPARASAVSKMIQEACTLDKEASVAWLFIGPPARYVVAHPIHTAILCELIAEQLQWSETERLILLNAALTMNIGKLVLQHKLANQKEAPSKQQYAEMQEHCDCSVELLKELGVKDEHWLHAVLHHHERLDGNGYPRKLSGEAIEREARVVSVGDVYSALVVNHAHRHALSSTAALKEVYLMRGQQLDERMAELLIKVVGIYPPGAYVRLANGETAVVTRHGATPTAPLVHSFVGPRGQTLNVYPKRDTSLPEFAIKEVMINSSVNVTLNHKHKLWGYAQ